MCIGQIYLWIPTYIVVKQELESSWKQINRSIGKVNIFFLALENMLVTVSILFCIPEKGKHCKDIREEIADFNSFVFFLPYKIVAIEISDLLCFLPVRKEV